ncbi:MAG: hypothetical protein ACREBE_24440 [bacterium]
MRALVALALLGGCVGGGSGAGPGAVGSTRPAVMPMLSELPTDPEKRNAILEQSAQTAGPEHRKGMTTKERKAETAAATAAAILGGIFSKTSSVTLGTATLVDENQLVAPQPQPGPRKRAETGKDGKDGKPGAAPEGSGDEAGKVDPADDPGTSNADLIPWIKLK